jgi:hypothetical protein
MLTDRLMIHLQGDIRVPELLLRAIRRMYPGDADRMVDGQQVTPLIHPVRGVKCYEKVLRSCYRG